MDEQQAMMPAELAKTTIWSMDSWQRAHDAVADDGRLNWDQVVANAITSGHGPNIVYAMISVLDEYSRSMQW